MYKIYHVLEEMFRTQFLVSLFKITTVVFIDSFFVLTAFKLFSFKILFYL